jgi:hypothetical protein
MTQMADNPYTSDSYGAACVDSSYHWRPVDKDTPRSTKLQLINEATGVATYGQITVDSWFTHWAPLPTFKRDKV